MARGKKRTEREIDGWIRALTPILQRGTALKNACAYTNIPYTTIRDWMDRDDGIRAQIISAENYLDIVSENVIAEKILKSNDSELAKWRLERIQKSRYAQRSELTAADGEKFEFGVVMLPPVKDI